MRISTGGKQLWGPGNLEQERHRTGEFPRMGAFEVFILSSASGPKGSTCLIHEAYSKLHHGRWPTVYKIPLNTFRDKYGYRIMIRCYGTGVFRIEFRNSEITVCLVRFTG
jgi:hypothetical protein